jgi:hypothetical protein
MAECPKCGKRWRAADGEVCPECGPDPETLYTFEAVEKYGQKAPGHVQFPARNHAEAQAKIDRDWPGHVARAVPPERDLAGVKGSDGRPRSLPEEDGPAAEEWDLTPGRIFTISRNGVPKDARYRVKHASPVDSIYCGKCVKQHPTADGLPVINLIADMLDHPEIAFYMDACRKVGGRYIELPPPCGAVYAHRHEIELFLVAETEPDPIDLPAPAPERRKPGRPALDPIPRVPMAVKSAWRILDTADGMRRELGTIESTSEDAARRRARALHKGLRHLAVERVAAP